jgi:micrococcal nuclease
MKKTLLSLLITFLFTVQLFSITTVRIEYGKCVKVVDGDTVWVVNDDSVRYKVRLAGIDAPEMKQPYGKEAKEYLACLVDDAELRIEIVNSDRYNRKVVFLFVDDVNLNVKMVSDGMTEVYKEYLKGIPYVDELLDAETIAKSQNKQIWSQGSSYVRPSDYRRGIANKKRWNNMLRKKMSPPLTRSEVDFYYELTMGNYFIRSEEN